MRAGKLSFATGNSGTQSADRCARQPPREVNGFPTARGVHIASMLAKIDSRQVDQSRDQQPGDGEGSAIGRRTFAADTLIAILVLLHEIQTGGIVMKTFMLFGTIVLVGISAAAGAATPEAQVMAPIRLFVDSFNKGDLKAAAAAFSPAGLVIIDDVSPHVWAGPNALENWSKALAASDQTEGNTDGAVTLGKPTREVVSGDRGYVVLPAVYTLKEKGVAMRETAQIVCALQKGTSGWQITGWTWVGTTPKPAAAAAK
jgi:hypothetical protein